jgi:Na+/H+ antiporter NhaD/arsenite permease-like protein
MDIHGVAQHTAEAFSWSDSKVLIATAIFLVTYALVLTEKINRAVLAVLGGGAMVLVGIMDQRSAVLSVDFNTIGLLLGMMIIVAVTKESGIFQYMAIWASKKVKASPMGILISLSIVTAVFSALLDNVTTVLLITPIILLITRELEVRPYPYLFAAILSSNIGGSATLIGDPPNIMIGSAADLSFNAFVVNLAPVSVVVMILTMIPIVFIWRKELVASEEAKARIMRMHARDAITDVELLIKAAVVLALVIFGFTYGHSHHIMPATSAMMGAALLLFLDNIHHHSEKQHEKIHHAIAEAEWVTLFFFAGLFVIVHGVQNVGVINWLAEQLMAATAGDTDKTILATLWGAAVISALVDNIPFVATMIPMIKTMAPMFGGAENLNPMWWSLALGACLGGNGSLIGASANLVVAGFAERAGHRISFVKFMLAAFPLMLFSILISHFYVVWRYL